MFAYRTTWIVKQGCMQKALELVGSEIERVGTLVDRVMRVYTPNLSPNMLIFEDDWESREEHDKFWAAYNESPDGHAFWAQWAELVERWAQGELWNVAEWR